MKQSHSKTEKERASSSRLLGRFAGQQGTAGGTGVWEGKVTFSLDGGEEGGCTQSSNCRAQRCLHFCPFRSQQHEWICSDGEGRGRRETGGENDTRGLEDCVGVFMSIKKKKKTNRGFDFVPLFPAPTHGTRLKSLDLKSTQVDDRSA